MKEYGNHPPVFLVGPRCCGKTTVAGLLARRLGFAGLDTDVLLAAKAGMDVPAIVAREGWSGFRRRESLALEEAAMPGTVVATGGGMVLLPENRAFMRAAGVVVYLRAPAQVLAARLAGDGGAARRPSLTGEDPQAEMASVLAEREPLYRESAHYCVDATLRPEAVVAAIAGFLELSKPL